MIATTREEILGLADKYHDPAAYDRASSLAWTHAQVQLHYLGIDHGEAHLYQQLANSLLYHDAALRPSQRTLQSNTLPVSALWRLGISGDRPIVLARIDDVDDRGLLRQLLTAHEYWNLKGLAVDLVLLNDQAVTYAPGVQEHLQTLVRDAQSRASGDPQFDSRRRVRRARRRTCRGRARAAAHGGARRRREHARQSRRAVVARPASASRRCGSRAAPRRCPRARRSTLPRLRFFNGLGGFTPDGREYVIALSRGQQTPLPWINVVANPDFGFQASESGAGFTWAANSRENQLTPWSNDPVSSPPAEVLLSAGPRVGRAMDAHCAADPDRRCDLRRAFRRGLREIRADRAGHPLLADAVRRRRRTGEDLQPRADERRGRVRANSRSRLTSNGPSARRVRRTRRSS